MFVLFIDCAFMHVFYYFNLTFFLLNKFIINSKSRIVYLSFLKKKLKWEEKIKANNDVGIDVGID